MGVNFREVEGRSALRAEQLENGAQVATGAQVELGIVRAKGKVRRIILGQRVAGVAGTSVSVQVTRVRKGVADKVLLATQGVVTLAAGAGALVDTSKAKDAIATPAGCTKPVLSAVKGDLDVQPGDILFATATLTGAYTTNPTVDVVVEYAPNF